MEENGINKNSFDKAYVLDWDFSVPSDDEYDAELIEFPGWEDIVRLASPGDHTLPKRILFEANFDVLRSTDYPSNDVYWPIMSMRMLDVLVSVEEFAHRAIPVVMVDDTVPTIDRYDIDGNAKTCVENHQFVAVQLLEHLDAFDWEQSVFKRNEVFPERVDLIEQLVLKEPPGGFPPVFRLSAYPIPLFVSIAGREALEKADIRVVVDEWY